MRELDTDLTLHPLLDRRDDWLLPWLDLYETAFPAHERMLVSGFLALLRDREGGGQPPIHLLAALHAGAFVGLVVYAMPAERLAHLWYLAVTPEQRNLGWGARVYQALVRQLAPLTYAMLLEVEKAEEASTPDPALAQRRLGFYRRQGARLLEGIHYLQSVGPHQPLTPMHVLVHAWEPLSPQEAFEATRAVFGESITQVGTLRLT